MNNNSIDTTELATDVINAVALAQLEELSVQSLRLAEMVAQGVISKMFAADLLHAAAVCSGLEDLHGPDVVQSIVAVGFRRAAT